MNIHELSRRTGVSLTKLRAVERLGVLTLDAEPDFAEDIRCRLTKNPALSLVQALRLLDDPSLVDCLGRVEKRARDQLDALGIVEPAPKPVSAAILEASEGEPAAAAILAAWIRASVPAQPVGYLWLATRLLVGLSPNLRDAYASKVSKALAHARALPELDGWWRNEGVKGRSTIIYRRASTKPLDL